MLKLPSLALVLLNTLGVSVWAQLQSGGGYRPDAQEPKHSKRMITLTLVLVIIGVLTLIVVVFK